MELTFWELTFWEVDILGVDILRVDISGVDILRVDILGRTRFYHLYTSVTYMTNVFIPETANT